MSSSYKIHLAPELAELEGWPPGPVLDRVVASCCGEYLLVREWQADPQGVPARVTPVCAVYLARMSSGPVRGRILEAILAYQGEEL